MDLTQKKCVQIGRSPIAHSARSGIVPCEGGTPPMQPEEALKLQQQVKDWRLLTINGVHTIEKRFKFKDFAEAMKFVNKVAAVAEEQGHHPDIKISWNKVTLQLTTHAIKGLSENDFIMAAKIDGL